MYSLELLRHAFIVVHQLLQGRGHHLNRVLQCGMEVKLIGRRREEGKGRSDGCTDRGTFRVVTTVQVMSGKELKLLNEF